MKKILAFFSSVTFLTSASLATSACGISKGQKIDVNIKNPPKKAKHNEDPLSHYVYNDKYNYNSDYVNYLVGVSAQLASDKIRAEQSQLTGDLWKKFYNSQVWQHGNFTSFNYDLSDTSLPPGEHDFSFQAANGQDLIFQIKDNDASKDDNVLRVYWFITSPKPWSVNAPQDYTPTRNTIVIPNVSEFKDKKPITRDGYLHLYLIIGEFRIDFNARITFTFTKIVDKNQQPKVITDLDTFAKPLGTIDFNHPEKSFDRIVNLTISENPS